jgi:hypothetical protein
MNEWRTELQRIRDDFEAVKERGAARADEPIWIMGSLANQIKAEWDEIPTKASILSESCKGGVCVGDLYNELIRALDGKFPEESRHDAALRCIRESNQQEK